MKATVLIVAASLLPTCTFAAAPHAIDFTAPILTTDGNPYTTCAAVSDDGKKCLKADRVTLGLLASSALGLPDKSLSLDEQVKRGLLAIKVKNAKAATLTSEEISLIKKQIATIGLGTVEVVRAVQMLDPAAIPKN